MDPVMLHEKIDEFNGNFKDHKLVPWMSWDEWDSVRISLFSDSPESVASALTRIRTWGSRGCLPIVIEVTASIIEIQQKDPHISSVSDSEEVLAMLYSMSVMRLVNGLVEKIRRGTKISIADAAASIYMPRMLIDIRHEASHRDLPSLPLLRQAATEALDWLKAYYWDPQKKAIPFKHGESANIKEEIRSRLKELSFGLKTKQIPGTSSSEITRKRGQPSLQICGRNKFFSVMPVKLQPCQYSYSKKQLARILKTLLKLYAFFSDEFVSVVLENLLGMRNSKEFQDKFRPGLSIDDTQAVFDKWEPVIFKLSEKEPELLLNLLTGVLDMIDAQTRLKEDDVGQDNHQIQLLSSLLCRLLEILHQLKPKSSGKDEPDVKTGSSPVMPKSILLELVRRCILISEPGNDTLFNCALAFADMIGDAQITERLKRLSVVFSSVDSMEDDDDTSCDANISKLHDKDFQKANRNIDVLKSKLAKGGNDGQPPPSSNNAVTTTSSNIWSVAESWNLCPIGMLPRRLGSSGRLPVLECGHKLKGGSDPVHDDKEREISTTSGEKRDRSHCADLEELDDEVFCAKRVCEDVDPSCDDTHDGDEENSVCTRGDDTVSGCLMINGVMQKVSEEEVRKLQLGLLRLFRTIHR